eukprot:Lithocolla_globosa_v1_NODE_764_length_3322_cov_2.920416.p2 type:complete len:105 gc:universal NODE_764_length_3322_cov_2.920416:1956-2270(+)
MLQRSWIQYNLSVTTNSVQPISPLKWLLLWMVALGSFLSRLVFCTISGVMVLCCIICFAEFHCGTRISATTAPNTRNWLHLANGQTKENIPSCSSTKSVTTATL